MAASLLGLGLYLAGTDAWAQDLPPLPPPAAAALPLPVGPPTAGDPVPPAPTRTSRLDETLHFSRDPIAPGTTTVEPAPARAPGELQRPLPHMLAQQNEAPGRSFRERRREQQSEESLQYTLPIDLPGPQRIFAKLQSDTNLLETIRQEKRSQNVVERINFPDEPVLSKDSYAGRQWAPLKEVVQPAYVFYKRLLFEQQNSERFGWDLGILQPPISALHFYADVALLPYHLGTRPCQCFEASSGYCLPGDPVPLVLYPPEHSWSGLGVEAAVVTVLFFAFP
jgi:hypothetical protein